MTRILLGLWILCFVSINLFAELNTTNPLQSVQEEKGSYIRMSAVPASASNLSVKIQALSKLLEEKKETLEIHASLPAYSKSINTVVSDPMNEYLELLTSADLVRKENEWKVYFQLLEKWNSFLNKRMEVFSSNKKVLISYQKQWEATREYANKSIAPEAIHRQISTIIEDITLLRQKAKYAYDKILTSSNSINTNMRFLRDLLSKNKEAQSVISSKLFYQNELPLFILYNADDFSPLVYFSTVYQSLLESKMVWIVYYKNHTDILVWFALISLIIFLFSMLFFYLYKSHKLFIYETSYSKKKYFFILLPFSTTLILMMLVNLFMFRDIPPMAKQFQLLLLIVPIFRIFFTLLEKNVLHYFYLYLGLYLLSIAEKYAISSPLDSRIFSLSITLGLLVYIAYMIKSKVLDTIIQEDFIRRWVNRLLYLFIFLLCIGFIADTYGAILLASRITNGIFLTIYSSILFYVLSLILTGYLIVFLRRRISSSSMKVGKFSRSVERNTTFFIKFIMTLWWFIIITKSVGIHSHLLTIKNHLMALSWEVGTTTLSIVSIFDFLIIVAGTWFTVKLINIVLEVEVFARFKFARGIPTAITTVSNYTIVITGTFMSLSSLGITSEQFTLVLGALGVGIGFGLRNIIANFISGIIMVFERPIQIGDTIEINNTMGTVDGIGTRSSRIKTFDGSEVIIPNADFISKEITNWTLSDERRRKTFQFKVALGSDIQTILNLMDEVISSHPNVLKEPEHISSFLGFGEYYLEFKAYYWLDENLIMAQSDITIAIYEALGKEGIKMPLPQQEILKKEA